jgi:hypothetical protein
MKTANIYVIAKTPHEAEITALRCPGAIHHDPDVARAKLEDFRARGLKGIYLFTLAARVEALRSEGPRSDSGGA